MRIPQNTFKQALAARNAQIGLWLGLANPLSTEALAGVGYDWLLVDGEHAPNDVRSILAQLQAVAPYASHAVVRPVIGDVALIKQLLDAGAQTLLVPMVDTAQQAGDMVRAMRYPPHGVRGVGSALARSSRWNQVTGYLKEADDQMCLLVQVETAVGMHNLDEIAAVDGVDGVFFGPADLSASMGHLGQPDHPDVQDALLNGIQRVRAAGKAPGILTSDIGLAKKYLEAGAVFVAVGVDTTLLVKGAKTLLGEFKARGDGGPAASSVY